MALDLRAAVAPHLDARPSVPEGGVPAGVLVPVIEGEEPSLVFTVRADTLSHHGGEVSFPGGRPHDEDPDLRATALRETQEELGIDPGSVEVLGALPPVPTFVSGFVVVPFVGMLPELPALRPNPAEIAEVLEIPVRTLLSVEREVEWLIEGRTWTGHVFEHDGHVIWGATARMLKTFLDAIREEGWE
ncbi:MAG TPA: CoA pyrophosphatase [Actinomycetota bacterium]|nr:CoA pyrophosphatase [Actinomycetota bacterium]